MKTVYLYDENGLFTGAYDAQESPLELGVYIAPDLSTDIEPIYANKTWPKFVDSAWVNVADNRGIVWDITTGAQIEHDELGVLPENLTDIAKPDGNYKWSGTAWEIIPATYQELRAAAYPDFRLYLDGIVKGDAAQVQTYIDDCLAVKAKYPKS